MSKTVAIPDRIHIIITKKQIEFREKYNINLKISEIISFLVEHNINMLKNVIRDGVLQKDTAEKDDTIDNNNITKDGHVSNIVSNDTEIKV